MSWIDQIYSTCTVISTVIVLNFSQDASNTQFIYTASSPRCISIWMNSCTGEWSFPLSFPHLNPTTLILGTSRILPWLESLEVLSLHEWCHGRSRRSTTIYCNLRSCMAWCSSSQALHSESENLERCCGTIQQENWICGTQHSPSFHPRILRQFSTKQMGQALSPNTMYVWHLISEKQENYEVYASQKL